ncbi:hypothetical protein EXU57_00980 [Segetibacter sp. 3557_3]|uniref:LamG-like jellyroll fold domain-containing protein n=1 Tax=Segetibacter sp. 3557_3 TaxID=2547429 RepID=UPI001058A467|nr:LamG-like jellyroll fold domain-containing protein [Segetibacter sp. 3557_3]TDH28683.1 hypothetical protein EXU57_00980 [Segetibacter sp. 3557_3]
MSKTLVFLRTENNDVFDGSVKGTAVKLVGDVTHSKRENAFVIKRGSIELGTIPEWQTSDSFTFEAYVTPQAIGPGRQNIIESQSPPAAFFIDPAGLIVGSVHTPAGWQSVQSQQALPAGQTSMVRFSRDDNGQLNLELNGNNVGSKSIPGKLVPVGNLPVKVGAGMDGRAFQFTGEIADVQIAKGAINAAEVKSRFAIAKNLEDAIRTKIGTHAGIRVVASLDESHSRLQPIKDIMNAAGVQKLSDLSTLRVTVPTKMSRGKILVAAKKNDVATVDWGKIATSFTTLDVTKKKEQLAKFLPNRNSTATFKTASIEPSSAPVRPPRVPGVPPLAAAARAFRPGINIANHIKIQDPGFKIVNPDLLIKNLADKTPSLWPKLSEPPQPVLLKTIPVGSSVIIAQVLDLTDTHLIIEPDVEKLYIIAEKVICGPNAKITWRRPGGSTAPRASNPDLNGRGWNGIHTKPGSRDGLDGDDGRSGEAGIGGATGRHAPALEMWVKEMTNIPNIDLNGEDGIIGGAGQRGGRGGDGADAAGGERIWFFGWHCTADPGDGGHGGDGGNGGRGGLGGRGGNGASLTIGVLDGTLAGTVTNNSFRLKNQGGQKGRGGPGGVGGSGGSGGRSGNGDTCRSADNGRRGAPGQPGAQGPDGASTGSDGLIQFFQFSEDAWEEMLTRPYITEVAPNQVFPGNTITLRGSRFTDSDRVVIESASIAPNINPDESLSITVPANITGGAKSIFVRRPDGTESNRVSIRVKPQLEPVTAALAPNATVQLTGKAFLAGAAVLINGSAIPASVVNSNTLSFVIPGTGGAGSQVVLWWYRCATPTGLSAIAAQQHVRASSKYLLLMGLTTCLSTTLPMGYQHGAHSKILLGRPKYGTNSSILFSGTLFLPGLTSPFISTS